MSFHKKFENVASDSHVPKTSFKSWKCTCSKLILCVASYFVEVSVKVYLSSHALTFENINPTIWIKFARFEQEKSITLNWDAKLYLDLV